MSHSLKPKPASSVGDNRNHEGRVQWHALQADVEQDVVHLHMLVYEVQDLLSNLIPPVPHKLLEQQYTSCGLDAEVAEFQRTAGNLLKRVHNMGGRRMSAQEAEDAGEPMGFSDIFALDVANPMRHARGQWHYPNDKSLIARVQESVRSYDMIQGAIVDCRQDMKDYMDAAVQLYDKLYQQMPEPPEPLTSHSTLLAAHVQSVYHVAQTCFQKFSLEAAPILQRFDHDGLMNNRVGQGAGR